MARHGNWVRDEPAREPIQVLTQDLVDHAVAALIEHGGGIPQGFTSLSAADAQGPI